MIELNAQELLTVSPVGSLYVRPHFQLESALINSTLPFSGQLFWVCKLLAKKDSCGIGRNKYEIVPKETAGRNEILTAPETLVRSCSVKICKAKDTRNYAFTEDIDIDPQMSDSLAMAPTY